MRIRYDPEVDALSVIFQDATVSTKALADGPVGEYDVQDRLVGPEILDAASRVGGPAPLREVTLEWLDLAASDSTIFTSESAE